MTRADAIVIGGGFYGCVLALHLARERGRRTLLLEAGPSLMARASYNNQARVHQGYHYPRSLLTGLRSRLNFERFCREYRDCIDDEFEKVYAIASRFSQVTAAQFQLFVKRIGAPIAKPPKAVAALFDPDRIEAVFSVREVAFDAKRLARDLEERLHEAGVEVRLGAEARSVRRAEGGGLEVAVETDGETRRLEAPRVFHCTYSRINQLLHASGLPRIPLKHELTEMALVEVPPPLSKLGVTVMCGPFFSLMPFPARGLHSLSHVRYTPHCEWSDASGPYRDPYRVLREAGLHSNFLPMAKDASRYLPAVAQCRQVDSLWEVKTVLPRSEVDDSRPILFKEDHGLPGLTCIMGSKIDNAADVIDFAERTTVFREAG